MIKKTLALTIPILVIFLLSPSLSQGQAQEEKRLTYEQVYGRAEPQLTAALPRISGWADDSHYLVMEREEGKMFEYMVYPNQRHGFGEQKRTHSNRHYVDFWFKYFLDR